MSNLLVVPTLIETTAHIDEKRAFEFWRYSALAGFGDVEPIRPREPFSAKRLTVTIGDCILLHTVSSPVSLEIRSRHIDRNAQDMVVIQLGLVGLGYQTQLDRGGRLVAGDLSFLTRSRPLVTGTQTPYEEIRLAVPRATFESLVGSVDALAGHSISEHPTTAEARANFQRLASSLGWMTECEAQAAIEGTLHLIGRAIDASASSRERPLPHATIASLTQAYIIRHLRDPELDPAAISIALGVSRTSLYRALVETGGIAAAIRDARLDLVQRSLAAPGNERMKISTVAYACGFTDVPTFNRSFRRRFGLSPRDYQAAHGDGTCDAS
ncbi:helix-turn-helix domain-containing protein [Methylobacterium oryzae CBMB20]